MQAIGRRFDPVCLHQLFVTYLRFETSSEIRIPALLQDVLLYSRLFDIVKKRFTRFAVNHVWLDGLLLKMSGHVSVFNPKSFVLLP